MLRVYTLLVLLSVFKMSGFLIYNTMSFRETLLVLRQFSNLTGQKDEHRGVYFNRQRQADHKIPVSLYRKKGNVIFQKYFRYYRNMLKHRVSGNVSSILVKSTEGGQGERIFMARSYVICVVFDLKTGIDF